jgi:hypothetical protein
MRSDDLVVSILGSFSMVRLGFVIVAVVILSLGGLAGYLLPLL